MTREIGGRSNAGDHEERGQEATYRRQSSYCNNPRWNQKSTGSEPAMVQNWRYPKTEWRRPDEEIFDVHFGR